eukprot:gene1035-404_t
MALAGNVSASDRLHHSSLHPCSAPRQAGCTPPPRTMGSLLSARTDTFAPRSGLGMSGQSNVGMSDADLELILNDDKNDQNAVPRPSSRHLRSVRFPGFVPCAVVGIAKPRSVTCSPVTLPQLRAADPVMNQPGELPYAPSASRQPRPPLSIFQPTARAGTAGCLHQLADVATPPPLCTLPSPSVFCVWHCLGPPRSCHTFLDLEQLAWKFSRVEFPGEQPLHTPPPPVQPFQPHSSGSCSVVPMLVLTVAGYALTCTGYPTYWATNARPVVTTTFTAGPPGAGAALPMRAPGAAGGGAAKVPVIPAK